MSKSVIQAIMSCPVCLVEVGRVVDQMYTYEDEGVRKHEGPEFWYYYAGVVYRALCEGMSPTPYGGEEDILLGAAAIAENEGQDDPRVGEAIFLFDH